MKNQNVDLWSTDEVHFQHYGSRCRMWMPPEIKDPVLLHHPTRKSVGYFGAVRLRDGKFARQRETDKCNAASFGRFMKRLKKAGGRSGRRVVVITDNAKYHHARLHKEWREENKNKFALSFLPPYSPDLNPIERVWKLVRRLCLHNQYFPELEKVIQTVEHQFNLWTDSSETLRKLCAVI